MKKLYTLLLAFVAVLGLSAQKTVTFDATKDLGSTADANSGDEMTKGGVTVTTSAGTFATSQQYRFYKGSTAGISAAEGNIVKIEFTCTASGTAKYAPGNFTFDAGDYTCDGNVGTWTGSASKVTFSATANQVRATQIVVTLDVEGGETPDPVDPDPVDPDPVDPDPDEIAGTGEGTVASPYDVTRALSLIANQANDANAEVYIAGTVTTITEISTQYGNATYTISDGAGAEGELVVYRGKYLKGDKFSSEDQLKVGDAVVVCGKLILYQTTAEVATNNYLYSINGKTEDEGGETPDPVDPDPIDPTPGEGIGTVTGNTTTFATSEMGLDNGVDATEAVLVDGTVVTFAQGEGNNAPKYYTGGTAVRMYALNTLSVKAQKQIASVTITHAASYGGNETMTASKGTISRDTENNTITVSGVNATEVELCNDFEKNSGGTQLRVVSIEIKYIGTGISDVEQQTAAPAVYDLSGCRVSAAKKGLYIVGGKKVLVK